MTQEDVIRLAKAAGMTQDGEMWFSSNKEDMDVSHEHLVTFAELVAKQAYLDGLENGIKAEREACALICENYGDEAFVDGRINADHHAYLIRQRGQA